MFFGEIRRPRHGLTNPRYSAILTAENDPVFPNTIVIPEDKTMHEKRYPSVREAEELLAEAEPHNPGPWAAHSRHVALCAEKIARASGGRLDPEKAYVLGLLHDIGRRFGKGQHIGHMLCGYRYLMDLGYPDAAKICLTHSYNTKRPGDDIGKHDGLPGEEEEIDAFIAACEYDDYDRLIQLCDCLGGAEGVMKIEDRMEGVRQRYGQYPQAKWDANVALFAYFEAMCGRDLYAVVRGEEA